MLWHLPSILHIISDVSNSLDINEHLNDFQAEKHYLLNFLMENIKEKSEVTFLESTKVSCFVDRFLIKQACIRYQEE